MELDANGSVRSNIDPRGVRYQLHNNSAGAPTEIVVNGRRYATYRYDTNGRLVETTYDGGWRETYTRDENGRVVGYRRISPGGQGEEMQFAWTPEGELEGIELSSPHASLSEPGRTLRRRAADGGETLLVLDAQNRIAVVHDPLSQKASFSYDAAGRLSQIKLPGGGCRKYLYDAAGRMTGVTPCSRVGG